MCERQVLGRSRRQALQVKNASYAPPMPGARRCTFLLPPTAHACLYGLAAREGRTAANVLQCLVLHALNMADLPIASVDRAPRARASMLHRRSWGTIWGTARVAPAPKPR